MRQHAGLAFAVFTAVWLALALQPCAAAMQEMATGHAGHGDCPHCPSAAAPSCMDQATGCDLDDALVKGKDKPPQPPLVLLAELSPERPVRIAGDLAPDSHPVQATGPPLNLRYCRFLE